MSRNLDPGLHRRDVNRRLKRWPTALVTRDLQIKPTRSTTTRAAWVLQGKADTIERGEGTEQPDAGVLPGRGSGTTRRL